MIVQGCPLVSTQLAKKLTSQRAGRLRRTQTIVQRAEPAKSQWKVKGQEPRSLFATRLATRRCESPETSGGRGRLSLNPHDDRSSYSSSSFLLFIVHFLRRLRLLLFHARFSCPSMAIFGQAMRRNATRRIPIVRSRSCIRKRRGRHRRPDASRTSSHASLNKPMRSCRVRTLRATYFCRTRGFRFDELSLSVLWVRPSLFLFYPPLASLSRLYPRTNRVASSFFLLFSILLFLILYSPLRARRTDVCEHAQSRVLFRS